MDSVSCTIFLFASFIAAGSLQVAWLKSDWSQRFKRPIDGGRHFRGKRVLGDNKTWRGFLVMPVGVGLAFALLGGQRHWFGERYAEGLWPLSPAAYFLVGCWVGFAFMLGELPNSFCKRQLEIAPGAAPRSPAAAVFWFFIDRLDSLLAALIALALVVRLPLTVWIFTIGAGVLVHWLFSLALNRLGVKPRAA